MDLDGVGGGTVGGDGVNEPQYATVASATGATQTTGYSFGQGANGANGYGNIAYGVVGSGGGGGGYYGGYAGTFRGAGMQVSGAGGSGYVNPILTNSSTIAGEGSTTNGYVKITKYLGYSYIE